MGIAESTSTNHRHRYLLHRPGQKNYSTYIFHTGMTATFRSDNLYKVNP